MNKIDLKDILQENLADDNQDYLSILGDEKEIDHVQKGKRETEDGVCAGRAASGGL